MSKMMFVRHPRSIVRNRHNYPSGLFVTIPAKNVGLWELSKAVGGIALKDR